MSEAGVEASAVAEPGAPPDDAVSEGKRTDPRGLVVAGIGALGNLLLPIAFVLYQARDEPLGLAFLTVLMAGVVALVFGLTYLQWWFRTYRVGDTDIRVDSGVLSRAARSVPYERIQDVSLEQSLIPRLFGLVEVRFETGAGGKDELKLAYLSEEEGERLREVIRARKSEAEGADAVAGEATEEPPPLFAMAPRRVFTFGLFEFSLAVVAVVGGLAQQFDFLLPFDLWDFEEWQRILAGPGSQLAGLGAMAQVIGGAIAVLSLVALGVATGMVRTVLRDWNFRLDRTDKGFRRRRGLFTRTDVVMPVHRVQALVQSTGIVRRLFGWHGLKFVSLAQDSGSASHDVAPFAQIGELTPIVRSAGFVLPPADLDWHRASRKYRFDNALLIGLFFGAMTAVVLGVATNIPEVPDWRFALIPAAFGLFLMLREAFLWRYEEHGWDAEYIYVRRGWLAPETRTASRVKLHSVEIDQGPIAQRRNYATVHLGLAGGSLHADGLDLARARQLRTAILASIAARDFSELEGFEPMASAVETPSKDT